MAACYKLFWIKSHSLLEILEGVDRTFLRAFEETNEFESLNLEIRVSEKNFLKDKVCFEMSFEERCLVEQLVT